MEEMTRELESLWLPFTPNKYFKSHPKLLASAKGMYFTDSSGQEVLDSCAGLWCVSAGHGQAKIVKAIQDVAETLDYAPSFQVSHSSSFELARRLSALAPKPLNHVFFTNSGSEAVDSALKIAMHYQSLVSNGEKKLIVGREKAYHGVGFGGISVGGLPNNQRHFQCLPMVAHLPHTLDHHRNAFTKGLPQQGIELADELYTIHKNKGPVSAVIVEPISGSAGVILPPQGYLKRLRDICNDIGALLIFDEVITGFGRIGDNFAANHFNITPDIITCAKGLSNGAAPIGAAIVRDEIYETIISANHSHNPHIEFFHGYTYSGHPLSCHAALATLDVYEEQKLFERAAALSPIWQEKIHQLVDCSHVIDVRNYGLMAAIELAPRNNEPGARAFEVFNRCFDEGLLIRITADTIALSPPLIIEEGHIDLIVNTLSKHLNTLA